MPAVEPGKAGVTFRCVTQATTQHCVYGQEHAYTRIHTHTHIHTRVRVDEQAVRCCLLFSVVPNPCDALSGVLLVCTAYTQE